MKFLAINNVEKKQVSQTLEDIVMGFLQTSAWKKFTKLLNDTAFKFFTFIYKADAIVKILKY